MYCARVQSGKETFWSQKLRNWNRWTHLKSMPGDSFQRKCQRPKMVNNFIFPIADGTVTLSGGDQVLRTSTLIPDNPHRGEEQGHLLGGADGSPPTPFQDSLQDDGDARNDFWSISRNYIYRHHVEPRVRLYVPREESFPIPQRYIDVTRAPWMWCLNAACTIIGISKETETCQTRGLDSHDSPHWTKNLQMGFHSPRGVWRRSKRHPGPITCGQRYGKTCQKQRNEKKNKSGPSRNRCLTMLEGCWVFTSSIQQMRSSRKLLNMRWESWKFRCQGKKVQGNLSHSWCSRDKIRMHRWIRRIYEKAFGRNST